MPRTLSATLAAVAAANRAPTVLLLDVDIAGSMFYWAERSTIFGGNTYEPRLAFDGGVRLLRSLQLDSADVQVENVSLAVTELLKTEFIPGAAATLRRLYVSAGEAITIFDGIVADAAIEQQTARFRIVSRLDPTAFQVPERSYSEPEFEYLTRELEQLTPPTPAPAAPSVNDDFEAEMDPYDDYR